MVVVKSKKILVLIIIALIVILFANIMIIKSKKFSKIEKEKEIVTEINILLIFYFKNSVTKSNIYFKVIFFKIYSRNS